MTISAITIENFKSIKDPVRIEVRPITLLFGPNSVGKSSVLQCLAMLAQSIDVQRRYGGELIGNGPLVDVGAYRDFIHGHDVSRSFRCSFSFSDVDLEDLFSPSRYYEDIFEPKLASVSGYAKKLCTSLENYRDFTLSFSFEEEEKRIALGEINLALGNDRSPVFSWSPGLEPDCSHSYWQLYWNLFRNDVYEKLYEYPRALAAGRIRSSDGSEKIPDETVLRYLNLPPDPEAVLEIYSSIFPDYKEFYATILDGFRQGRSEFETVFRLYLYMYSSFECEEFLHQDLTMYDGFLPCEYTYLKPEDFLCEEFIDARFSYQDEVDFFNPLQLVVLFSAKIKEFLRSFTPLGPVRKLPERYLLLEGDSEALSVSDGNRAVLRLVNDEEILDRLNQELAALKTGYQAKISYMVAPDGSASGVFMLQFIDQKTGIAASLKDVGFGFSQLLPIVIECVMLDYGALAIEQPELHLHPALQTELGDMFIRASCGEDFAKGHNCIFIETHSEHLILRLLRRIRENSEGVLPEDVPPISKDDIAVIYLNPGEHGVEAFHIPVTEDGDFAARWPNGFFAERAEELF